MHVLWMKAGMGKAVVKFNSTAEEQLVEMYGIWKAEMMMHATSTRTCIPAEWKKRIGMDVRDTK